MVNILSGGLHAEGGLAFQDFLAVPVGARSYSEAIEIVSDVRSATGELLDARGLSMLKADEGGFGPAARRRRAGARAARRGGRPAGYAARRRGRLRDRRRGDATSSTASCTTSRRAGGLDAAGHGRRLLERLVERFPVVSIEDGLGEDDWEGWALLTERLGERVQLIGDDLFTTNSARLARGIDGGRRERRAREDEPDRDADRDDRRWSSRRGGAGYATVVSARSGETEDPFIADLAVATARRPDQDRIARTVGAAREVQPAPPDRGGAGPGRRLRGRRRARLASRRSG